MASQTTNISSDAICMLSHSVYSLCMSAHAPGVGCAKRLSINGFKCTECDAESHLEPYGLSQMLQMATTQKVQDLKNNPATIKNI